LAESGDATRTLAALIEHRELTWDEVVNWSSSIATELCTLHEQGSCHGDVTAESIWIENGIARLSPPADLRPNASADQDILMFSVALRQMVDQVPETADEERLRSALEQIASTNSRAASGGSMKKVSAALTLLRFAHQIEAMAQQRTAVAEPKPVTEAPEPAPQVLLLAREVSPEMPPIRRIRPKFIHLLAYLGLAFSIVFVSFLLFLKLSH
jgi:hypothetical protein